MAAATRRPNILFMMADDHRHDAIAAAGDPTVRTPTMDRLIASGTRLRQARIMGGMLPAVCVPSRACMHTGNDVFHAMMSNVSRDYHGQTVLRPEHTYLAETFRLAGYSTFGTGKWHNCTKSFNRCFTAGDEIFFGGMGDHLTKPVHSYDPTGEYPQKASRRIKSFSSESFSTAAIEFLTAREPDAAPFFVYVGYTSPHDPRMAPAEFQRQYPSAAMPLPGNYMEAHPFDNGELTIRDEMLAAQPRTTSEVRRHIAEYYAMIAHQDYHMGRILATLEARGELENTIVVYTGDHGLAVGQHGLLGKQNLYEHSTRIPLLLSGPGIPAGAVRDALVYGFDLFPTLCELSGIPVPASVTGRSAAAVVRGAASRHRATTYAVYCEHQASVTDGEWKAIRYYPYPYGERGSDRVQLFHLASDPLELNDLSPSAAQRERLASMLAEMVRWQTELGDPLAQRPAWGG